MGKETRNLEAIFSPGGLLARSLPHFEYRIGQKEMAEAVLDTLLEGGKLLVEAGTGTGKTLAYLIPAALSGRKVVVSTGTKNLQDQILSKEIPFLQGHFLPDLKVVCLKGRKNYLCLYKWRRLQMQGRILFSEQEYIWPKLDKWLAETIYADRSELDWLPDDHPLWNELSCSAEQCLGSACQDSESCYVSLTRREAARADIVVVNHHLFFSDVMVRDSGYGEVIPRYEAVIFDEAHHIEDIATAYLGNSVSNYRFLDLLNDAEQELNMSLASPGQKADHLKRLGRLRGQIERFFGQLPFTEGRVRIRSPLNLDPVLGPLQDMLKKELQEEGKAMEGLSSKQESFSPISRRFFDLARDFTAISEAKNDQMIYWIEKKKHSFSMAASPLDVSRDLQEKLYAQLPALIFTSATLTVQKRFDFYELRLGLEDETRKLIIESPFDYQKNTLLYIPEDLPEPGSAGFAEAAAQEIELILEASSGRALVLFTSYRNMEEVYGLIIRKSQYPLWMQGQKPRRALLDSFREDVHSVLLATSSFWEGIDVPGESLSCVIIDKLPFGVPSDPIVESRLEWLAQKGQNPFITYQLPLAVLNLRQGFGRLIRSANDRGILAVLDVRTTRRPYGRTFLQSLPQMPITHDLSDVKRFFSSIVKN